MAYNRRTWRLIVTCGNVRIEIGKDTDFTDLSDCHWMRRGRVIPLHPVSPLQIHNAPGVDKCKWDHHRFDATELSHWIEIGKDTSHACVRTWCQCSAGETRRQWLTGRKTHRNLVWMTGRGVRINRGNAPCCRVIILCITNLPIDARDRKRVGQDCCGYKATWSHETYEGKLRAHQPCHSSVDAVPVRCYGRIRRTWINEISTSP